MFIQMKYQISSILMKKIKRINNVNKTLVQTNKQLLFKYISQYNITAQYNITTTTYNLSKKTLEQKTQKHRT